VCSSDLFLGWERQAPAPAIPVATTEKPAPADEKPAPSPAAASPAPATEAQPAAQPAATAPAATAPAATAAATPPAAAAKAPETAKAPEPAKAKEPAKRETAHAAKKPPAKTERTVAKAEPAPAAAAKPTKKGDDLLNFEGNDSALNDALGGGGSGRSVYVPPPSGGDALPARVSDSQVNETIMTRVSALQQCLAENKSGESGVLKMRWSIAPDGSVQNLKCITPESASTPFAKCVTNVLKPLRFPKTVQGRSEVTFPFKF
jgi:membrane protein involved in colicin uptake